MEAVAHDVTTEDELRDLIESWRKAAQAKDIDRIVSHYAPEIVAFDAIAQLQFRGVDAYRTHWEACLVMCPGAMIFEVHDLSIAAGDDYEAGESFVEHPWTENSIIENPSRTQPASLLVIFAAEPSTPLPVFDR